MFADFVPPADGESLTLGADLAVAGDYAPAPLPRRVARPPRSTATPSPSTATWSPGEESELTLTVSRDGRPVTDLQPYLGAYGHLVALRDGDLAYLHVHPAGEPGDGTTAPGPDVALRRRPRPSAGTYRLFLDFQHGGRRAHRRVHRRDGARR